MSAYQTLERRFARLAAINDALGILHWDTETLMPPGAADGRAEQLATLKVLSHELLTDDDNADLLADAEHERELSNWQEANLHEMRRAYLHATAVPGDLVEASSRAISRCEMVWREARPAGDFAMLLPSLSEVLNLQRQIAAAKAEALGCSLYEALLDSYEPGGNTDHIDKVFGDLRAFLPGFIGEVLERQKSRPDILPLQGPFPIETQRALGVRMMQAAGFDFNKGRLDISLHPFCGGATHDVRLTTRYDEDDFTKALMGVMHETGHALYEQNRPADWLGQPVSEARGMSLHESQSLIIEMQACRSRAFLEFAAPVMRDSFGGTGPAWDAANLHRLYTKVEPGFIRVDADEVTYPAHILIRYDLEKALIAGDMILADLPGAWNEGMRDLLGLKVTTDRLGCLQDIHWPGGAWGYFPTYTLGAITAAQLFDAATRADDNVLPGLARGDFSPLVNWLRTNIHSQGSLLPADQLLTKATGRPLDASVYERHLRRRYLEEA
ncbi:carboxypeptidase M32 [Skermanella aerolata]|uniref:Metal-dependent carboxypeptidase n=1 Tax=Skermanella aerolata TaxID=393310 RepID=A0A512DQ04_9PROT|nr:carboxypeptidase M32 [Skermanella aerolata]KJB92743.1 peptidase M32 [Skermanella aerolata KACC 11604]GEO38563.1 carboxypeptidase M32 [Skermanella aerolata]